MCVNHGLSRDLAATSERVSQQTLLHFNLQNLSCLQNHGGVNVTTYNINTFVIFGLFLQRTLIRKDKRQAIFFFSLQSPFCALQIAAGELSVFVCVRCRRNLHFYKEVAIDFALLLNKIDKILTICKLQVAIQT